MKVCGIIAEFNPFHYGHEYLITQARTSPDDLIIVVMSGSFVQRGEVAIYNKWTRAQWAIQAGADIVVELPVVFSLQSATFFAHGAVLMLSLLGCTSLCFGSEMDAIEPLQALAHQLNQQDIDQNLVKKFLQQGESYPQAFHHAYTEQFSNHTFASILQQPNATLALFYLQAIDALSIAMQPQVVLRQGASYHDSSVTAKNPSATAIRQALNQNHPAQSLVPSYVHLHPTEFATMESLYPTLLYLLRVADVASLCQIAGFDASFAHRLLSTKHCTTYDALLQSLKTKNKTQLRIQRALSSLLLGLTQENIEEINRASELPIHLLAIRSKATPHLRQLQKKNIGIWSTHRELNRLNAHAKHIALYDIRATDIQALAFPSFRPAGQDFTHSLCFFQ